MAQLIDKSALVAEIKRIEYETDYETFTDEVLGKRYVCKSLLSFIDTLEVKEVDIDKEIANQYESNYEEYLIYEEFADIAKHFFKLGMAVGNKVQKGEKV